MGTESAFSPDDNLAPKLVAIANKCSNANCPTIYRTDRGTLVVQGYRVPIDFDIPPGELVVEIPVDLLQEAAASLAGGTPA